MNLYVKSHMSSAPLDSVALEHWKRQGRELRLRPHGWSQHPPQDLQVQCRLGGPEGDLEPSRLSDYVFCAVPPNGCVGLS